MPASGAGGADPDATGVTARGPEELATLLRRSAQGDDHAFALLYDQTASRVHGLVQRILRDPAQSEEVTQEVFLEVWRTAARFETARGSALGWMLTMAHRRAVDRVRATESSRRRDGSYHVIDRRDHHDQTDEAVRNSLEVQAVRDAMAGLTPLQREALELAYFAGRTCTEVASILDVPTSTAKTRIRDGLIRLRDGLTHAGWVEAPT